MAVGSYNGSIYLIGGVAAVGMSLTKYSIDLNTVTLIEPTPWTQQYWFNWGQYWTQQDDIVYVAQPDLYSGPGYIQRASFHGYYYLASSTDYIYITGADREEDSKLLQALQISTGQWTMGNQMNVGRRSHSCVASGRFL
eukprot:23637_1